LRDEEAIIPGAEKARAVEELRDEEAIIPGAEKGTSLISLSSSLMTFINPPHFANISDVPFSAV
jgi:hypothetical protein